MDESHEIHQVMQRKLDSGFKYCPKCSSPFFQSRDDGRSYKCEICDFHYYINNSAAVACLITNEMGELLLTRRAYDPNKGMLDLPGGFVEPLESVEEAIVREIKEELNLDVLKIDYLISYPNLYPFSGMVVPTADLAFICEVANFESIKSSDDVASFEFVHPTKIVLDTLCADSMKKIIRFYQQRINH